MSGCQRFFRVLSRARFMLNTPQSRFTALKKIMSIKPGRHTLSSIPLKSSSQRMKLSRLRPSKTLRSTPSPASPVLWLNSAPRAGKSSGFKSRSVLSLMIGINLLPTNGLKKWKTAIALPASLVSTGIGSSRPLAHFLSLLRAGLALINQRFPSALKFKLTRLRKKPQSSVMKLKSALPTLATIKPTPSSICRLSLEPLNSLTLPISMALPLSAALLTLPP